MCMLWWVLLPGFANVVPFGVNYGFAVRTCIAEPNTGATLEGPGMSSSGRDMTDMILYIYMVVARKTDHGS